MTGENINMEQYKKYIVGGVIFLALIIFWPFKIVQSTDVGLKLRLGKLQEEVLEPGIHWRTPFLEKIKVISLQPIQLDYKITVGTDGAITKDNQTVGTELTIFYAYNKTSIRTMYQKFGEEKLQNVIQSTLKESFKEAVGTRDIFNIAQNQNAIQKEVIGTIQNKLKDYPVEIRELKITNYDWSDNFDQAIAQTMEKAQQVKKAEQDLLLTEQNANKKVKEAEADKNALIAQAEGEKAAAALRAEAKALEGEGIRKYNQSVQSNMALEIQLRQLDNERARIDKWNGQYVANNNYAPIPFQAGTILK